MTSSVSDDEVATGSAVKVQGKVAPSMRRTVVLEQYRRGRWVDLDIGRTTKRGAYAFGVPVGDRPGSIRLRVSVPKVRSGGHAYRAATSRAVEVLVTEPAPPTPVPGTLAAPYAVGQVFSLVSWRVSLGTTDLDAWPEIQVENMFNEPPGAGWSYVMVPVALENAGTEEMTPWLDLTVEYLGGDGVIYRAMSGDQSCGVVPSSLDDVNDMYPGARASGNQCAAVPSAAVAGGHWRVTTYDARYDRKSVFVAIA